MSSFTLQEALDQLPRAKKTGNVWRAPCPAHQGNGQNLAIWEGDDGSVGLKCHSRDCDYGQIVEALNLNKPKTEQTFEERIERVYQYCNADRELVLEVVRLRGPKDFRQRDPAGRWSTKKIPRPLPLYHLPELLHAEPESLVVVVEGEKDVERAESIGLVATTTAMGSQNVKHTDLAPLAGRIVAIVPDNDDQGRKYATAIQEGLDGITQETKLLILPNLSQNGDLSDWVDAGGTFENFLDIYQAIAPAVIEVEEANEAPEIPPLDSAMFQGIAGEFVRDASRYTEAHPVALLAQLLTYFGATVGRGAYQTVAATTHPSILNVAIVGRTGHGRKGDGENIVKAAFAAIEGISPPTRIGGVGSGEGIIKAINDGHANDDGMIVGGTIDKRLLVVETELAKVFRSMKREGSSISATLRQCWDGSTLQSVVKIDPLKATDSHVCVIGHITPAELSKELTEVEIANGLGNRFIFVYSDRVRSIPEPDPYSPPPAIADKLRNAVLIGTNAGRLRRSEPARQLWKDIYEKLHAPSYGVKGELTARGDAIVMRLSATYALLDGNQVIEPHHLTAALDLWAYSVQTIEYLYGSKPSANAMKVMGALRAHGSMTRKEVNVLFGGHISASEIDELQAELVSRWLITVEEIGTGGRTRHIWGLR
jgi:hypothetical protein